MRSQQSEPEGCIPDCPKGTAPSAEADSVRERSSGAAAKSSFGQNGRRELPFTEEGKTSNTFDRTVQKIVTTGLGAFRIQLKEKTVQSLIQFIKFGLVGISNTVISYLLNIGTLKILEPFNLSWDYVAANVVEFLLSVLWAFYWNNKYVFTEEQGKKRSPWITLLRTYAAYAFTGILLKNILSYILIDGMGISKYVAPVINLIVSVPINFLINKRWAFKA